MADAKQSVSTQLQREKIRAVFTHCYGHSLSLSFSYTIKNIKIMRDSLDTTYEILELIKRSPRRNAVFDRLKCELVPVCLGIRVLCSTR